MGIVPDIVTTAKGIGGGFPLAATLCTASVASCMSVGTHGSTYGSNPLACAVGLAVLKVIKSDGFLPNVQQMGLLLENHLQELVEHYPTIFESTRGIGLMQGLVLQSNVDKYGMSAQLRQAGLLVAPAVSNVIRILPPLIIEAQHVEKAVEIIDKVCYSFN
jgi:acetylornithine/N-succinyldiaminopimelate aminotransferase